MCKHPARIEIELQLAGGAGQRAVGTKYKISKDSVFRHWTRHVDEERKARLILGPVQRHALAVRVSEESASVLDNLKIIGAALYEALDAAMRAGDRNSIALLSGKLHENQRLVGQITGDLANSPLVRNSIVNHFHDSAEYERLLKALQAFGKRHPELLNELAEMIESLEEPLPVNSALPALEHRS